MKTTSNEKWDLYRGGCSFADFSRSMILTRIEFHLMNTHEWYCAWRKLNSSLILSNVSAIVNFSGPWGGGPYKNKRKRKNLLIHYSVEKGHSIIILSIMWIVKWNELNSCQFVVKHFRFASSMGVVSAHYSESEVSTHPFRIQCIFALSTNNSVKLIYYIFTWNSRIVIISAQI